MIQYPFLEKEITIGVTAPSSGVPTELHELLKTACNRLKRKGYSVICGDTAWTQDKAKSAPASKRAEEFNEMMMNDDIHIIIPPWGGELLIETLEFIDFDIIQTKWILGYSDISLLLLAITLKTGIATAHGTNFIDLRGEYSDKTTAVWESVLSLKKGNRYYNFRQSNIKRNSSLINLLHMFLISQKKLNGNQFQIIFLKYRAVYLVDVLILLDI